MWEADYVTDGVIYPGVWQAFWLRRNHLNPYALTAMFDQKIGTFRGVGQLQSGCFQLMRQEHFRKLLPEYGVVVRAQPLLTVVVGEAGRDMIPTQAKCSFSNRVSSFARKRISPGYCRLEAH